MQVNLILYEAPTGTGAARAVAAREYAGELRDSGHDEVNSVGTGRKSLLGCGLLAQ